MLNFTLGSRLHVVNLWEFRVESAVILEMKEPGSEVLAQQRGSGLGS